MEGFRGAAVLVVGVGWETGERGVPSRGPGGTLGKPLPIISSFESLRQAQPLAGMWLRVTKSWREEGWRALVCCHCQGEYG